MIKITGGNGFINGLFTLLCPINKQPLYTWSKKQRLIVTDKTQKVRQEKS